MAKFKSEAQRKRVMALLRERGFKQKPIAIGTEGKYARIRIVQPSKFQKDSFKTLDVGKKGGTKVIIGRKKGKVTTSTQAVLIPKAVFFDGKKYR